jgi:hypothetical protein
MTNLITLENRYCKFTFMQAPKQVRKLAELPNWFITVGDRETQKSVKLYLQIDYDRTAGGPHDIADVGTSAVDPIIATLKDKKFIAQFGELVLNNWMQKAPNESENYRVSKQFYNFFQRRGRDTVSVIESATSYVEPYTSTRSAKITPITLSLDSDAIFKTVASRSAFKHRYKCISGCVTILGQVHFFELSHPLFDLSLIMTAGDARKNIVSGLRKTFPFIEASDITGWTFDNQVHGK